MTQAPLRAATEQVLRELAPQVLGALVRRYHDFAAAEDAVQEALIAGAAMAARRRARASARAADPGGRTADDGSASGVTSLGGVAKPMQI